MKRKIFTFLFPLVASGIISLLIPFKEIYQSFIKPPFSPPAIIFPIVWTILYLMMGYTFVRLKENDEKKETETTTLYKIQLGMNYLWPILFFSFRILLFSLLDLLGIIIVLIIFMWKVWRENKTLAFLQIPYLLWLLFAFYLNFGIYLLN